MSLSIRPLMHPRPLSFLPTWFLAASLLATCYVATSTAIEISGSTLPGDTELQIQTGSVAYSVDVRGTTETANTSYPYLVYVTGADIYGNAVYLPVEAGTVTVRGQVKGTINASGAAAVANLESAGSVASIAVTTQGAGYTTPPIVNIDPPPPGGVQALASAFINGAGEVIGITINQRGSGYTTTPAIGISGGGGAGATAQATLGYGVGSVDVTNGGANYSEAPTVFFSAPPNISGAERAEGTAAVGGGQVVGVAVTKPGFLYLTPPSVTFAGGGSSEVDQQATTARISGRWVVPNDGTLHNTAGGYRLIVAIYQPGSPPSDVTNLGANLALSLQTSGRLTINVIPDLAINAPGVVYAAGSYRGRDIIRFAGSWRNDGIGQDTRQSRPLRSNVQDRYTYDLRLSTDAQFRVDTQANDDFSLLALTVNGDLPYIPDGSTQFRKITVTGTPGAVDPYGLAGITGTVRNYTPQPDDGFLDIGERVQFTVEQLIPGNYTGRYFVAARVRMSEADLDASTENNIFVSNAANKVEILENASPLIEPASAISDQNGLYVAGGNGPSDFGSVSENGNLITFASTAGNLLVPPNQFSGGVVPAEYTSTGQQIFLKDRQTREVQRASRTLSGTQANADCFNPVISANGRYIAYDSAATNLSQQATGGRSMIYVVDTDNFKTVIVSRNTRGDLANGSSFKPVLSQSGRFVAFESIATNLELAEFVARVDPVTRRVTGFTRLRGGAGYTPGGGQAIVTIVGGGGSGATATASVNGFGQVTSLTLINGGSGYTSVPEVRIAAPSQMFPPLAGQGQVYLHDRDVDGNGAFDEAGAGKTATYLVSVAPTGSVSDNLSFSPAVNLEDSLTELERNGGVYVAFASYGQNMEMPNGNAAMIYRTLVDVSDQTPVGQRGPIVTEVVSLNDDGQLPVGDEALGIVGYSVQPAINGDGSQVAFTSNAMNLVYNEQSESFDGDTNMVQDVFVRNFRKPLGIPGNGAVARLSVSRERVATGTIVFAAPRLSPGNLPVANNPTADAGESITISDGFTTKTFTFTSTPGLNNVVVGANVQETRDNLVAAINFSDLNIDAEPTTPPNVNPPGTAFNAGIYLKNKVPGKHGNVPFVLSSPAFSPLSSIGMAGGGTQAEDDPVAIQGVPFGSSQPSIDRSGRFVAFRSIARSLDVHVATDANSYPVVPPEGRLITGELIRPLIFPTSNVYVRDRLIDGDEAAEFDRPSEFIDDELVEYTTTTRVSLNKFGYPTLLFGTQVGGLEASTSANSSSPALSANGRFVVFSSDAEGQGGLVFGPNNLTPLDNEKFRDVFVYDSLVPGATPPQPTTKPVVTILAPGEDLTVAPNTDITITAAATPSPGKNIARVELFVGDASSQRSIGVLTAEPFSWTYRLQSTGQYLIRVVATDSKGLTGEASVTVTAANPPAGAPFVQMTQPIAGVNFVTGSKLFLNARATATGGATIKDDSVRLSVNGVNSTDPVGKLGNEYGVLYTPTVPFVVDTYRASATDSKNVSSLSAPLFSFLTLALSPLPTIKVLPISSANQVNAGQVVTLAAEAFFPQTGTTGRIPARVEFYVNKVYVGEATAGAALPNGRTLYTLNWEVSPGFVNANVGDGAQTFEVYARAVALNWQTNTDNNNVVEIYGSVVDGPTPLTVFYVPSNPPLGSNAAFVIDSWRKLFLREPTYDEFSWYLGLLNSGFTQAQTVVQMAQSTEFTAAQQVLFGYYVRMGLAPTSKTNALDPTGVSNLLNLMTNGTNTTPLPATMSAGISNVPTLPPPPFGATVGQALVAQRLIENVKVPFNGSLPRFLDDVGFMRWMSRSFYQPYLPQAMATNGNLAIGVESDLSATISNFPTPASPPSLRFGYSYAFVSALYSKMPTVNVMTNNGLRSSISNFPALVKGAAVSYLLSPTGQWPTNAFGGVDTNAVLSTNLVASNLPPQITSTNRVTGTLGQAYTNFYQISAINVGPSPGFAASGLPPGLTSLNSNTGVVSGTPTTEGVFNTVMSATNAVGTGQLAVVVTILPAAPQVASATATATNGAIFSGFRISYTPTNTATSLGLAGELPPGLFFTASNGTIAGIPAITNAFTDDLTFPLTMFATNKAGVSSNSLVLTIKPSVSGLARFLAEYSLSGAAASATADPDGDGFSNAIEFAFGMRPDRHDDAIPVQTLKQGDQLVLSWSRPKDAASISYVVSSTADLANASWTPVLGLSPRVVNSEAGGALEGYERVSVTINPPESGRVFYRIEAEVGQ